MGESHHQRLYRYVGPHEISERVANNPMGARIASISDLEAWMRAAQQRPDDAGLITATFIVDADGYLCIADRYSEHVACAGGEPVLSAGELSFARVPDGWVVAAASNQSTGYCPELESWPQAAAALERIPLQHPGCFTAAYIFRRCPGCGQLNIVKDDLFECAVCGMALPAEWNCDRLSSGC